MDTSRRDALRRAISEYDAQGWHRTGTDVDNRSADWLCACLRARGIDGQVVQLPFDRFEPGAATLVTRDLHLDGLPMFDGGTTPHGGIRGRLGPIGSDALIGVTVGRPNAATEELREAREDGRHAVIVTVSHDGQSGLAVTNATRYDRPYGPPVLQLGSEHHEVVSALCEGKAEAKVTVLGLRVAAAASNVVGYIPGRDPSLRPIVLMTPRSGWWHCASERGTGIACWLETADTARRMRLQRDVYLVASTGHELGFWGMHRFMETADARVLDAALWVHFGASIGAAVNPRAMFAASTEPLRKLTAAMAAEAGLTELNLLAPPAAPAGESGIIHARGGNYVSFLGSSDHFHLQTDRWPSAVDLDVVERYCVLVAGILEDVDRLPAILG
jgi:hypothetical protein